MLDHDTRTRPAAVRRPGAARRRLLEEILTDPAATEPRTQGRPATATPWAMVTIMGLGAALSALAVVLARPQLFLAGVAITAAGLGVGALSSSTAPALDRE